MLYELFRKEQDGGLVPQNKEVEAKSAAEAAEKMGLADWFEGPNDTASFGDLHVIPENLW